MFIPPRFLIWCGRPIYIEATEEQKCLFVSEREAPTDGILSRRHAFQGDHEF